MSYLANGLVLRSIRSTSCLDSANFILTRCAASSSFLAIPQKRFQQHSGCQERANFHSLAGSRFESVPNKLNDPKYHYREAVARVAPSKIISASEVPPNPSRQTVRYASTNNTFRGGSYSPGSYSPNSGSHTWLLYTILGMNTLVFMGWQYSHESARKYRDPRPYFFMSKNFLSGSYNLHEGRWWTLFTSSISHETFDHFLLNMLSLAFMSPPILALVGPTTFLGLYFGAGAGCSLASIGWKRYITPVLHEETFARKMDPNQYLQTSHGASGSIFAVMTTFALLSPHTTFLIFFVLPLPAWLAVSGIFTYDFVSALTRPDRRIDSAGHIGGVFSGYVFWKYVLKGLRFARR